MVSEIEKMDLLLSSFLPQVEIIMKTYQNNYEKGDEYLKNELAQVKEQTISILMNLAKTLPEDQFVKLIDGVNYRCNIYNKLINSFVDGMKKVRLSIGPKIN